MRQTLKRIAHYYRILRRDGLRRGVSAVVAIKAALGSDWALSAVYLAFTRRLGKALNP